MNIVTDCTSVVIPDGVHATLVMDGPGPDPFNPAEVIVGSLTWWSNGIVTVGNVLDDSESEPARSG